jgi:hypothetical protein
MRWTLLVAGLLLVAVGGVWIFQGAGVLKGSFMTGDRLWLWIGVGAVVLGIPVFVRGLRSR